MKPFTRLAGVGTLVAASGIALAAPALAEGHGHDAHVHGEGSLNLVQEGNAVLIELEVPAANIVGFEHDPRTDAQNAAVAEAVATLRNGSGLFAFPAAAKCRLAHAGIRAAPGADEKHAGRKPERGDGNHGDKRHGTEDAAAKPHDDAKNHEAGHEHEPSPDHERDQKHEGDRAEGGAHSDFEVTYRFECANPDNISHMDIGLFRSFPGNAKLVVRKITSNGQGRQIVTPAAARVSF